MSLLQKPPESNSSNPSSPKTPVSLDLSKGRNLGEQKSPWKKRAILLLLAFVVIGGGAVGWPGIRSRLFPERNETEGLITDAAKKGPFEITVTERGTLDSMKNAVLSSKVEGATTIISIVPEGTTVNAGDLVCELDSSTLTDKETAQEILVVRARAMLEQANEGLPPRS
jgi:HlyD family secretion protein